MITCKEDLLKTYVVNDGEIRGLYVGLCNKFGIECESNSNASGAVDVTNADYIEVYAGICFYTNTPSKESSRELTIKDLQEKPKRVKVSYVKVEDSIFDLRPDFEAGELFQAMNDESYEAIIGEFKLAELLSYGLVCRKVETETDERQEFIDEFDRIGEAYILDDKYDQEQLGEFLFDNGFRLLKAD